MWHSFILARIAFTWALGINLENIQNVVASITHYYSTLTSFYHNRKTKHENTLHYYWTVTSFYLIREREHPNYPNVLHSRFLYYTLVFRFFKHDIDNIKIWSWYKLILLSDTFVSAQRFFISGEIVQLLMSFFPWFYLFNENCIIFFLLHTFHRFAFVKILSL